MPGGERPLGEPPGPALRRLLTGPDPRGSLPCTFEAASRASFLESVDRCREYILAGDVFQANLSQRFEIPLSGTGVHLFERILAVNPSPYAGYLRNDRIEIVSGSPECLIRSEPEGQAYRLTTRPIAGTYPRGKDPELDRQLSQGLRGDPKERSEHIMLVDLERSDLGRVCRPGSVQVEKLLEVETYSHVHHLVSTVTGLTRPGIKSMDVLAAVFPGGTITGAPKIRAMQIIDELESFARGPYTGSMGWVGLDGSINLSILIRTLVVQGGRAHLQVGAGIVWDSRPEREFEETLHKARASLLALGVTDSPVALPHQRMVTDRARTWRPVPR